MTRTRFVIVLIIFLAVTPARAADSGEEPKPRLRPMDSRIRSLLEEGLAHSPSLRALVERLSRADVVVYLKCGNLPSRLDGQLTFVSAAGGLRYVLVQLAWDRPVARRISALGHELQHAVEISEHPSIVDRASLAREYSRFGFASESTGDATAFDTAAANETGHRVWRELAGFESADD